MKSLQDSKNKEMVIHLYTHIYGFEQKVITYHNYSELLEYHWEYPN